MAGAKRLFGHVSILGTLVALMGCENPQPNGVCLFNCETSTETIDAPQAQTITGGNITSSLQTRPEPPL